MPEKEEEEVNNFGCVLCETGVYLSVLSVRISFIQTEKKWSLIANNNIELVQFQSISQQCVLIYVRFCLYEDEISKILHRNKTTDTDFQR